MQSWHYPIAQKIEGGLQRCKRSADVANSIMADRYWPRGLVTLRQRDRNSGGATLIRLEDEGGIIIVRCSNGIGRHNT